VASDIISECKYYTNIDAIWYTSNNDLIWRGSTTPHTLNQIARLWPDCFKMKDRNLRDGSNKGAQKFNPTFDIFRLSSGCSTAALNSVWCIDRLKSLVELRISAWIPVKFRKLYKHEYLQSTSLSDIHKNDIRSGISTWICPLECLLGNRYYAYRCCGHSGSLFMVDIRNCKDDVTRTSVIIVDIRVDTRQYSSTQDFWLVCCEYGSLCWYDIH